MNYQRNIIPRTATIAEALARLNSLPGTQMTLFVTDGTDSRKIVGTLTDGDVRRALLAGTNLSQCVDIAMHRNFMRLNSGDADHVDAIRRIRDKGITMAPVVDRDGNLTDILDLKRQNTVLPLDAILMAGGKGERLRPLTLDTPKPLLQIEGKAIIDYNIEALLNAGIRNITVCTRYMADKICRHFSKPVDGTVINCITEDIPLGTLGAALPALRTFPPQHRNTLIMNSDLLTTVSFEEMYLRHRDTDADITVGVIPYQVSVPFAVLNIDDDDCVTDIEEKPSFSYYANGGIYIFRNSLLSQLPADCLTDAPDFIRSAINRGFKVSYHVINGTWIDIGSHTDFNQARQLMKSVNHFNSLR